MTRLARLAWSVLAWNVAVILWGAYVRASGSGAGCGSHWPLCNGDILPRAPAIETLIEFSHRATSGLALLAVVGLAWWTWRACPKDHPARVGVALSLVFMLTEAAVGAGLVLFELVADNVSLARALFMAVHLVNTFILLGLLTLTAWWLSDGGPLSLSERPALSAAAALGVVGMLLASASGAVAALGDTLYPSGSLAEGLRADLSPTSHVLIRLRLLHPAITIGVGTLLVALALRLRSASRDPWRRLAARAVVGLTVTQLLAGAVNVLLLAPVWMQMLHLLLADLLWIAFVLLCASALATPVGAPQPRPAAMAAPEARV